jgi:cbb3-type cytochrome oxidase subunit 3
MNWVKQLELAISLGPTLVTILFVSVFVGALVWIYRPGSKRYYNDQAQLPLQDSAPLAATSPSTTREKRNG